MQSTPQHHFMFHGCHCHRESKGTLNNQTKLLVAQAGKSLGLCRLEPPSVPVLLTVAYVKFLLRQAVTRCGIFLEHATLATCSPQESWPCCSARWPPPPSSPAGSSRPELPEIVSCQALRHLGLQFFSPPTNDDKWSRVVLKV